MATSTPRHDISARVIRAGFSLVEVTLALGVVSFAVLVLTGTMTSSLGVLSEAKKGEIGDAIHRVVASRLQTTDFSNLPDSVQTIGFDFEGLESSNSVDVVYQARISRRASAQIGGGSLPAESGLVYDVEVFRAPAGISLTNATPIHRGPVLLANREKNSDAP